MAKIPFDAGTQWGGLNKRVDPVEISPEQSPDCANVFFYDQTIGLLGPRPGKAYAGASEYTIWGVLPYNISGQIGSLVAYGDDTSTEIDLISLYSVSYPHGGWGDLARDGPVVAPPAEINRGFYHEQALSGSGTARSDDLTVSVNAATTAFCTNATLRVSKVTAFASGGDGKLKIYGTFDGGVGRQLLATMALSWRNPGSGDNYFQGANTTVLLDITGASMLTLIDAAVTDLSPSEVTTAISGTVVIGGV